MLLCAFNNIQHRTFAPSPAVYPRRTHGYDVAVHHAAHLPLVQNKIAVPRRLQRYGESKTVFMCLDAAFHQIDFICNTHRTAAVNQNLPVACHRFQTAFEKLILGICNRQLARQSLHFRRHAFLFQQLDNPLAAWQRMVIALPLAF